MGYEEKQRSSGALVFQFAAAEHPENAARNERLGFGCKLEEAQPQDQLATVELKLA